jgi:hypothetical protein
LKLITSILLTVLLAFAIGLFEFPWWSFALTTLAVFVAIPQNPGKSFLAGFISIFSLWIVLAVKIDLANEHLLSTSCRASCRRHALRCARCQNDLRNCSDLVHRTSLA